LNPTDLKERLSITVLPMLPNAPSIYDAGIDGIPAAYGGNDVETLGAAGGWIASPAELLKLVAAIDNQSGIPTISILIIA
jgi:hypothetical protein